MQQGDHTNAAAPKAPGWHQVLMCITAILYALLVVTGTTTSSLGVAHLNQDGAAGDSHLGELQGIRSDEYNVATPVQLSMLATGSEPTLSPLGAEASIVHRYPVGPVQTIVFWDALPYKLGPVLPDAQLFAAHWWLPTLLLMLCMPVWFHLMGGSRAMGWLAAILVAFAPANFWWSLQLTQQTAYVLAGCTALLAAGRRFERGQRTVPVLLCIAGGISIAGMPSNYLLWSMLLGGGVLLATTLHVLATWRKGPLIALLATGLVAAVLGGLALWEGREGLLALSQTLYPGERSSTAAPMSDGLLFGAPLLSSLAEAPPSVSNESELSSAYTVALAVIPFAWLLSSLRSSWRRRLSEIALASWSALWFLWSFVTIGDLGELIPIARSVPPERAAQAIGVTATIAACMALSHVDRRGRGHAALAGVVGTLLTARAGADLRREALPFLDLTGLWVASLLVGLSLALLLHAGAATHRRWRSVPALVAVIALLPVVGASPLQFGLGDLRNSQTAQRLAAEGTKARDTGALWVADGSGLDPVMLSNAVPSLSGLQRSGPDLETWSRLDRDGTYEEAWNRGGGYVAFAFDEGVETRIETDGYDFIRVVIDPCTLVHDVPEITHLASASELAESDCLSPEDSVQWNGTTYTIFGVRPYPEQSRADGE